MKAPTPKTRHPLGHAGALGSNPLVAMEGWMNEVGDVVRLRIGRTTAHVLFRPEHVRHVLQESAARYGKQTRGYRTLSLFMGDGLLTADGAHWHKQSRMIRPAFGRDRMAAMTAIMTRCARAHALELADRSHGTVDVSAEMMRLTLRIISEVLFGRDLESESSAIAQSILTLQEEANRRITAAFEFPPNWPTPQNRRLRRARQDIAERLEAILTDRRKSKSRSEDLLDVLLEARDEDGKPMSDAALRDELITLFLAGHESTSHALTWTCFLLASHPEVRARLQGELRRELGDRPLDATRVSSLPYLGAVVKESLRLYPPAWSIGRAPIEDEEVGGFELPAGKLIILSAWATHRHPNYWTNPNQFQPQRWLDDEESNGTLYRYFPFGAGPRTCIGARFATLETHIALAEIWRRMDLEIPTGHTVEAEPLITLRPRGGLPMEVRPLRE